MKTQLDRWRDRLHREPQQPAYRMIAYMIAEDVERGHLSPKDRLPPLRDLAAALCLNYTTAARGYTEARRQGLIDSKPGMGTFVKGRTPALPLSGGSSFEMTMNLPTEPALPQLLDSIRGQAQEVLGRSDLYNLLRYQDFGGDQQDREAGAVWLQQSLAKPDVERILVCPGVHSVLVGLLSMLARDGGLVCTPNLVYPGLKAIAAQLKIPLQPLACHKDGPNVRSFEDLCKSAKVSALYLNPTLQNPSTLTLSNARREALADVALRYSIPIIEDDAYAALPSAKLPTMADRAPELTYYITGLSKCFGAGLRVAYVQSPNRRVSQRLAGAMRALNVMASPVTNALASEWILRGTAQQMLNAIRHEAQARQAVVARVLGNYHYQAAEECFHLWLHLPADNDWNPANVAAHLRAHAIGAVSSAAFSTDNNPPKAIRICLGGSQTRDQCEEALLQVADLLDHPSHLSTVVL